MLVFLVQGVHVYTHRQLIDRPELGDIRCWTYDRVLRRKKIPPGTYVFTDRERLDSWELRVIAALYAHLRDAGPGYRVVNDPARMQARPALLRALFAEGLNDFNAYAVTERARPARYPVFIRRAFDHAKPLTGLLRDADELDSALADLRHRREPEDGLLITEYCAEPVAHDLFRKLSAYRIGSRTFFHNAVHERDWLVKYGTVNAAGDALYRDEARMIRDNAFGDTLTRAFDIAGVDYGRADFGLVDGRPQIYEINSNPYVAPPSPHPDPTRQRNVQAGWRLYCDAINALDNADRSAPVAPLFKHRALRRGWRRLREPGAQRTLR